MLTAKLAYCAVFNGTIHRSQQQATAFQGDVPPGRENSVSTSMGLVSPASSMI